MRFSHCLLVGRLAALVVAFAGAASANQGHADASSTTRAAACKLSVNLARQGIPADQVTATHCECLENKEERAAPWSCTGFVDYR